jgi:hypothetical protein
LAEIDIHKLVYRVKIRLDEVFPESDDGPEAWKQRRESLADALANMRAVAGALQWRVPLRLIQTYAQELSGIQPLVADNTHLVLLVKVQSELCRHMLDRRRNISPQALMLLLRGFTLLERLAMDRRLSAARGRELVAPLVRAHLEFKQALAPGGVAAAGKVKGSAGNLARRAYYLIPVDHLEELRRFVEEGFEELRSLISQRKPGR